LVQKFVLPGEKREKVKIPKPQNYLMKISGYLMMSAVYYPGKDLAYYCNQNVIALFS